MLRRPRQPDPAEPVHGKFMYDFEDVTYYFCSQVCRDEFAQQPEKYAKNKGGV